MQRPALQVGQVARIGLIVPPTNTVHEAEAQRLLREHPGISLHATRMALHTDSTSAEGRAALERDLARAVADLAAAPLDAIAYACTAGSMVAPLDALSTHMRSLCGLPCVATAPALVHAARALGLRRVAVGTPYGDTLNHHERVFLEANGIEVLRIQGLGIGEAGAHEYPRIARLDDDAVMTLAREAWHPQADGLILSCTDLPTLGLLPALEVEFGRPVITSNLATMWAVLHAAGVCDGPPTLAGLRRLERTGRP